MPHNEGPSDQEIQVRGYVARGILVCLKEGESERESTMITVTYTVNLLERSQGFCSVYIHNYML